MKILHYALGFSPYRSGGMTRYVEDLMAMQKKDHEVGLLWPGQMRICNKKIGIKKRKTVLGIANFELINPLPVPLLEGVRDIPAYMGKGDRSYFFAFLKEQKPDVIHIHTFMGLYVEFLEAAGELGIKTVFTTHDYYAICPKVNMLCNGKTCETGMDEKSCSGCDMNPLSMNKIRILQSPVYRFVKESSIVRMLRKNWKRNKQTPVNERGNESEPENEGTPAGMTAIFPYGQLKEYYRNMLQMISVIHGNSTLAAEIYERFVPDLKVSVVPISNQNIVDKRVKKGYNKENPIRITYLGPASEYKGYFMLVSALDELNQKYEGNFVLHVYTPVLEKRSYMKEHDSFGENGLDGVLHKTDILVAPSIWKETFGFVALEALSRGVPVLVTENVGAKDLVVHDENGLVVAPQKAAVTEAMERLIKEPQILQRMNEYILKMDFPYTMEVHAKELMNKIYQ